MRLDPGAEFAGHTIERVLGAGGMGTVYLASQPRLARPVALKVLDESIAGDARGRAGFEREAALAARLDHPNIVPIYDRSGSDAEFPWLSMKYVAGGDTALWIVQRGGPLSASDAVRLLTGAARGLDYAHRLGIVHRDIKPANILVDRVDEDARAVLTDFGIARALDDTLTLTGFTATLAYTAPERFGRGPIDHRADIYSLGCTLFEFLTGSKPFPYSDHAAIISAHLHTAPPRPTASRPELPSGLDDVIATAMAKNPQDRFPSCGALAAAAAEALRADRGPVAARQAMPAPAAPRATVTIRDGEDAAPTVVAAQSTPSRGPSVAPRRAGTVLAVTAALLAICGGVVRAVGPRLDTGVEQFTSFLDVLAILAVLTGALAFVPLRHRLFAPAALIGLSLTGLWGTIALIGRAMWMSDQGFSIDPEYHLFAAVVPVTLVFAGICAAVAVRLTQDERAELRLPRTRSTAASALVGILACLVTVKVSTATVSWTGGDYDLPPWVPVAWAIIAAAPLPLACLLPRPRFGAITTGWALGGFALLMYGFHRYSGFHEYVDGTPDSAARVPALLIAVALVGVIAVGLREFSRAPDQAT